MGWDKGVGASNDLRKLEQLLKRKGLKQDKMLPPKSENDHGVGELPPSLIH
jgi:hypothetical protein